MPPVHKRLHIHLDTTRKPRVKWLPLRKVSARSARPEVSFFGWNTPMRFKKVSWGAESVKRTARKESR
jgi:hypothetical protein